MLRRLALKTASFGLIGSSCIAIGFTCHFSNMDNKNGSRISSYSKNVDLIQYKADVESWEKIETDPIISSLGNVCDLAFSPYTGRFGDVVLMF
ncbi:hypothetical protein HZS_1213 [Henneguya salminicola]|nr:hypothetical protein HZS_1213 [Henneguya salminicola]